MRQPSDVCLLCQSNLATQTNSHILSGFISRDFLGPKQKRRGNQVTSKNPTGPPKLVQDSPKEDYILCPSCESYLNILETRSTPIFKSWQEKVACDDFILNKLPEHGAILDCVTSHTRTIWLFVYSLFWRASICSGTIFANLKMTATFEEEIRIILLKYKSASSNEYLSIIEKHPSFPIYPITAVTAMTFKDETYNLIAAPPFAHGYKIIVDKFSFILHENFHEGVPAYIKSNTNASINHWKMLVFSQSFWEYNFIQPTFDLLLSFHDR